jgi:hypothetical protein
MVWYSAYTAVGTDLLYAAFTKMVVFMCIIKKRISIGPLLLAITRQRSCCITYFMDFTYKKQTSQL